MRRRAGKPTIVDLSARPQRSRVRALSINIDPRSSRPPGRDRPAAAAALVCASAVGYSTIPVVVHTIAADANPFAFDAVAYTAMAVAVWGWLAMTAPRFFAADFAAAGLGRPNVVAVLGLLASRSGTAWRRRSWLSALVGLAGVAGPGAHARRGALRVAWTPILWMGVSRFDYAMFAWATHTADTAVVTVIFELWPIAMIVLLLCLEPAGNTGAAPARPQRDWLCGRRRAPFWLCFLNRGSSPSPRRCGPGSCWRQLLLL